MIYYTLNKTSMSHLGHNTEMFTKLHSVQQSNNSKALYVNQRNYYDVPCSVLVFGINTLRTRSFKLFKRPLPGLLTILTLSTLN